MRCLALADGLLRRGVESLFICRPHRGNLIDLIGERGHEVFVLTDLEEDFLPPSSVAVFDDWLGADWRSDAADTERALSSQSIDWLIVDHYGLDVRWERQVSYLSKRLMVIDDLANRQHECDLLLDQNLGRSKSDYCELVPHRTQILIGPLYALIRKEFEDLRTQSLARRMSPQLRNLLIAMGGIDKDNFTGQILEVLRACELPSYFSITVVMGQHAPWLDQVIALTSSLPCNTQVLSGVSNMADLMVLSDLAIGAAGGSAWERCCVGLPSLVFVIAANQKVGADALEKAGATITLNNASEIKSFIQNLFMNKGINTMRVLSEAAAGVTDGAGTERVIDFMELLSA